MFQLVMSDKNVDFVQLFFLAPLQYFLRDFII